MGKSIVLVDICGTLYDSNTTFDFLDFSIKNKKYAYFRKLSKSFFWKLFNKISFRLLHIDITRTIAVRFLKGISTEKLALKMEIFYNERLFLLKQNEVFDIVNKYISEGKRVVLVSATLDFISRKISDEMNIKEFYSTTLNYHDGICQGSIKNDLLSNKLKFLKLQGISNDLNVSITDNFSDMDLLKASERSIIISKKNNKSRWENTLKNANVLNFEMITL